VSEITFFTPKIAYSGFFLYLCTVFEDTAMTHYVDENKSLKGMRDEELRKIYVSIIKESGINSKFLTRNFVVGQIQKCNAPRFYITPHMAAVIIWSYRNGKVTHKSKIKLAMVQNLMDVYEETVRDYPNEPMYLILERVVTHPAKSFYMSSERIMEVIYQYHDRKPRGKIKKQA